MTIEFCAYCGRTEVSGPFPLVDKVPPSAPGTSSYIPLPAVPICADCKEKVLKGAAHAGQVDWCDSCEQWTIARFTCWGCGRPAAELTDQPARLLS
jgi:hypothetical protein